MSQNTMNRKTSLTLRCLVAAAVGTAAAGCAVQPVVYERPPPPPPPNVVYETPAAPGATVTVAVEPPALPVYEQPPCPEEGYIWTPGYWAWGGGGYYWVPGTWVEPPRVGVLWTPPYWGWVGGSYVFHPGYWGPHVGFYGGINYGFGYVGVGFVGGHWDNGGRFAYNTAVSNVNTTVVHNTYNNVTVVNNTTIINNTTNNVTNNRVSFAGGPRGVPATPTSAELAAAKESHVPPTPQQLTHFQQSAQNPSLKAAVNQGHPPIAATPRPAAFSAPGVVAARPPAGGATPPNHQGTPQYPNSPSTYHSPNGEPVATPPVLSHPVNPPPPPAPAVHAAPPPPAPAVHTAPPPAPAHPAPAPKAEPKEHEHPDRR